MRKEANLLSEVAMFVAGALAVGLMSSGRRRERATADDPTALAELRRAVADLESRVAGQESLTAKRLGQIEAHIEEQSAKLKNLPSTDQIVGAMEQLIAKTMASLDDRMTTQAQSIETMKTTVSQTDLLLERVLASLDSLNTYAAPVELDEQLLNKAV